MLHTLPPADALRYVFSTFLGRPVTESYLPKEDRADEPAPSGMADRTISWMLALKNDAATSYPLLSASDIQRIITAHRKPARPADPLKTSFHLEIN